MFKKSPQTTDKDQIEDESALMTWINTTYIGIQNYNLIHELNNEIKKCNDIDEIKALSESCLDTIKVNVFLMNLPSIIENLELLKSRQFKKVYKSNKSEIKEIKRFIDRLGVD